MITHNVHNIRSKRLMLRPVCDSDWNLFVALFSDSDNTRYLPGGKPYSTERIQRYLVNRVAHWQHGFGTYTIFLKKTTDTPAVAIGYAGVEQITDSPDCVDIRYAILPKMGSRGYAFEAAEAVLNKTFATTSLTRVYGVAVAENQASIHILQKLGMQAEPTLQLYDAAGLLTFCLDKKNFSVTVKNATINLN